MNLCIMPYLNAPALTQQAIEDVLAQSVELTLLLIDNGSAEEGRHVGEEAAAQSSRVLLWQHSPPLRSLSAVWNRALQFAWACGCEEAWVVNNDVRLWSGTYQYLQRIRRNTGAWFVTATGVTPEQFTAFVQDPVTPDSGGPDYPLPGPDYSCFLLTKEGHERYPFDENYVPCYVEDVDHHRRMMLGGDGARIFGTGLPFEHVGSGTLNGMSAEARARKEAQIGAGSRTYHARKWGGGANEERYTRPFDPMSAQEGVTTTELFERVRNGAAAL